VKIPNFKLQIPNKSQILNLKIWNLVFGTFLSFDFWHLDFGGSYER